MKISYFLKSIFACVFILNVNGMESCENGVQSCKKLTKQKKIVEDKNRFLQELHNEQNINKKDDMVKTPYCKKLLKKDPEFYELVKQAMKMAGEKYNNCFLGRKSHGKKSKKN